LAETDDMGFSEKAIETVVDRLYDLVSAKKSITVREVAKALSISETQTEKLARLLESSKLVQVNYSLSDIIISIAEEAKPAQAPAASHDSDSAERALLSSCDEIAKAKSLLEYSRRQVEQLSKKIVQVAPQQAAAVKANEISPVLRKKLEGLESDAQEAKSHAQAALAAATVLEEASRKLSAVAATRKGARQ